MKYFYTIIFISIKLLAQEIDISGALKSIEVGKVDEAVASLQKFKDSTPSDPSVIFLDAILTTSGEESVKKYSIVFDKYPKSKYADIALYRVFSYYYSLGLYKKAESYLMRLKIDYPASPYIAAADRKIPDSEEFIQQPPIEKQKVIAAANDSTKSVGIKEIGKFTIQAGAFLNAENANKLKEQLIKDGLPSEIISKVVGGSLLKIVTAGRFSSEQGAKSVLSKIEPKYNLKGRIIPINPKP
jgi:cell division septation protein DedD